MKKKLIQIAVFGVLIAAVVIFMIIQKKIVKDDFFARPSNEHIDLYSYYGIEEDNEEIILFLNRERIKGDAVLCEERIYLSYQMVKENLNDRFYWDESAGMLIYTTPDELLKYTPDSAKYTSNGENRLMTYVPVLRKGETVYIALEYVTECSDVQYSFFEKPARLMLVNDWDEVDYITIKEDASVRTGSGVKKPIVLDAKTGEEFVYLGETDGWTCIQSEDGVKGYIETKHVGDRTVRKLESTYKTPYYSNIQRPYKINLVWQQITSKNANNNLTKLMDGVKGVNVISPTWFLMCDSDGNIESFASQEYVDKAHAMGLEVWALVENITYRKTISTNQILSNMESRERLVSGLISETLRYGIDGINVDIESLSPDAGEGYIQFLRELSIECRKHNIVLSVDNPAIGSPQYHRKEQGIIADYVIIMGYDEHYSGQAESGSTASYGWVENGIAYTLKSVPADKVINAVPFYTRIWKQTPEAAAGKDAKGVLVEDKNSEYGRYLLTSEAVSMAYAEKQLRENGVTPVWNSNLGQYYGEYKKDGCTYQIWLEEEKSIELKMQLIEKYELAGVAGWKLSLQKNTVWEVMSKYLK